MKYMGSKRRLAPFILPIMEKAALDHGIKTWIEPFVGGGNCIDKVSSEFKRIGYDINPHAIAALIDIRDQPDSLPDDVSEELYKSCFGLPAGTITSWIRFVCAFGGRFERGYARGENRNYAAQGKRNAIKQSPRLKGINFKCASYCDLVISEPSLIYCDPPYKGTESYKTDKFDHERFFSWCEHQVVNGHIVYVSEYAAPEHWECALEKEQTTHINNHSTRATKPTERLFKVRLKIALEVE